MRPNDEFRIRWRAFQLNPEMPLKGMDRQEYLEAKFGGAQNAERIYENIASVGESVGINFRFELIQKTPNTLNAHRLIRFFQEHDRNDVSSLMARLFEAYFLNGLDIGQTDILVDLAGEFGVSPQDATKLLESDRYQQEVTDEDLLARRIGINGVPCFIVDGQYALSGAQEAEAFIPLFDLAANKAASTGISS